MNHRATNNSTSVLWTRMCGAMAALAVGAVAGAGILGFRHLFYGNANPFGEGWPIFLNASTFAATFIAARFVQRRLLVAVGLYFGLALCMLASNASAYPMSSCLALGCHGFLPALAGALASRVYSAAYRPGTPIY